jgi:hypothetical protein
LSVSTDKVSGSLEEIIHMAAEESEILLYQTEDKRTRIEVTLSGEMVWLSQAQMAELFQTTKQNISLHIRKIFLEKELHRKSVVKDYLTTATDGKRYKTQHYNLDVIISVGYRVKSHCGTQFRIWATQRLREYLIKGFTLDDERLKEGGSKSTYFDELLDRVRAIRASERMFYQKITDIYATSMDYDVNAEITRGFFATVQNKFTTRYTSAPRLNSSLNGSMRTDRVWASQLGKARPMAQSESQTSRSLKTISRPTNCSS